MKKISDLNVKGLIGGIDEDYFEFWCQECGRQIMALDFHSQTADGAKLKASCENCGKEYFFKIRISIPLGPATM